LNKEFRLNKNIVELEQIYTNNQAGQAIAADLAKFVNKRRYLLKSMTQIA